VRSRRMLHHFRGQRMIAACPMQPHHPADPFVRDRSHAAPKWSRDS
jgi:hypothetical protein